MRKFFISIGYVPDTGEAPEVVSGLKIRTRKNNYLIIPVH